MEYSKVIETIKEQLKKELNDSPFRNADIRVEIGKDGDGDLTIQAIWSRSEYYDDDRFGGFRDATFIVGRHCFTDVELGNANLLKEAINDFVGVVDKIPEKSTEAYTHLKYESLSRGSRVFNTAGLDQRIFSLKENETICKNGKYFDEEEKYNNKNELNNEHVAPDYEKYRNKRDDDDGGDDSGEGPVAELTPSYDDEDGMEL